MHIPIDDALLSMNFKFLIDIFEKFVELVFKKSISKRVPQPADCDEVLSLE